MKVAGMELPTRKKFFGREDPTRFGGGALFVKGLQDPLYKVLPAFGGGQIKKTISGAKLLTKGFSETPAGKVRFLKPESKIGKVKAALFGEYGTPEAREYFDKDRRPLGEKQTERFKELGTSYYKQIMEDRKIKREEKKLKVEGSGVKEAFAAEGGMDLPTEVEDLSTIYKSNQSLIDSYRSKKAKIKYGDYTDLEKTDKTIDLEESYQFAQDLIKQIEEEKPEQVFEMQLDTYKSGGGTKVDKRAEWSVSKIKDLKGEERQEMINTLWEASVLTGKSNGVAAYIKENFGIDVGKYTGKATGKGYGTKAKVKKAAKISFKKVSAGKISTPAIKFKTPVKVAEIKKARIAQPKISSVKYNL